MPFDIYEQAWRYIAKAAPAISGQGGHDQTFSVACTLVKGFDLSIAEARPLLWEYNQRCQPEWSGAELEHKLHSADTAPDVDQFGTPKPRGWLLPHERPLTREQPRASPPIAQAKAEFAPSKLA